MKIVSLILLGSVLTIALQFIDIQKIILISNAEAGNSKACRVIDANENEINNLFRFGYRVKGVGASAGSESSYDRYTYVIMCKG